ncbi:EamA/RhaT family transporter, partial [Rhizobium ruizarguesonis]
MTTKTGVANAGNLIMTGVLLMLLGDLLFALNDAMGK